MLPSSLGIGHLIYVWTVYNFKKSVNRILAACEDEDINLVILESISVVQLGHREQRKISQRLARWAEHTKRSVFVSCHSHNTTDRPKFLGLGKV